ncbi:MAG: hypothetical protein JNL80_12290 [Phycisphaerae bacterium]|nr:hypothetical protein [Phycisphaerae bacterium]
MLSGPTRFPIGLLSLLVWALAWALPLGRPLYAQGTVGEFPDPITSVEFAALLRLHTGVTEVEWPVLHVMHEDYIAAAAVLRHGEIQAFLDERTRRMGSFFNVTVEKELLPRRRRAIASLEALERTLFDGVAAILGEGAEERVVGARLDRRWQLATFTIGQQGLWQSRDQTLAGVVLDHRWSEVEKSVVLPRCRAYQERVVGILDRLVVVAADAVPFEGLNGGPVSDATASARESARRAKSELQKCHRAFVAELSRDLEAAVGPEVTQVHMLRIRSRWIQAKYGGIWSSVSFDSPLKAGLRKRGITEEERLGLEAAIVELRAEDDRLIEEGMRLLDADEIAHVPGTMNQSNPRAEEIRTARSELFRKARAKAAAILGETISRSLERKAWARDQSDPTWTIDPNESDPAPKVDDQRASFMPFEMARRPMDLDAVRRLAGDGATPAETSAALETIHAEYLARWEREVSPLVQPASAGVPRGMQAWPEQLRHAREIAVAVEVVDASLFSALATAFGPRAEDSLRQARLNRQFELWTSRPMAISGLVSQVERPWNPLSALRS